MLRIFFLVLLFIHFSISINISNPSDIEGIISPWDNPSFAHIVNSFANLSNRPKLKGNGRIINGFSATLGQFPFMSFLLIQDIQNNTHGCGGSLIKMNWVLTAAHCLWYRLYGYIFIGITDLKNGTAAWKGIFNQSNMFIHPEFTMEQYMDNDIALIKIPQKIPCHKHVGIIDLPCSCDGKLDLEGADVTTMGFGTVNGNTTGIVYNMNYVTLNVMSNCDCKKKNLFPVFDTMICTDTSSGMSSCYGDSGSGLTAQIYGRTVLVGIVSYGNIKCLTGSEFPAIFTRVSSYVDWIKETMLKN